MAQDWEIESFKATMAYAVEGIRALLVANGGAVLAILTFAGNTIGKPGATGLDLHLIAFSLRFFGAGLGLAVFTTLASYFAQACYTQHHDKKGAVWHWIAVGSGLGSLIAFVVGSWIAASAFPAK